MARAPQQQAEGDDDVVQQEGAQGSGVGADDQAEADQEGAQEDGGEHVVCTITRTADGEYKLYIGDEPEEGGDEEGGEGAAQAQGEDQGAQGAGQEGEGAQGEGEGQDGTVYQTVGELLKGVLDAVRADHDSNVGGQTDQQSMEAGYAEQGGPGATQQAPMMGGGARPQ